VTLSYRSSSLPSGFGLHQATLRDGDLQPVTAKSRVNPESRQQKGTNWQDISDCISKTVNLNQAAVGLFQYMEQLEGQLNSLRLAEKTPYLDDL
jgi:hypothetical protein